MLTVKKIDADRAKLSDPEATVWKSVPAATLKLTGTPLGTQPTQYMRASWKDRKIGAVAKVSVRLCHTADALFIRLEWDEPTENRVIEENTSFPDGAAVLFPLSGDAPINTMGNETQGVNAWHWRADSERGRSVVAFGLGTTEPSNDDVKTTAVRTPTGWHVVISRDLAGTKGDRTSVDLSSADKTRIGVAVWEGSNGERAGFKAYTEEWVPVEFGA